MKNKIKIVGFIPSRIESKRIYQKPLVKIDGLPIIIHTMKRAMLSKNLHDLYVCTNSKKIANLVTRHGGKYIMTSSKHRNGSERIGEAIKKIQCDYAIDIQGDEPMVMPKDIDKVVNFHLKNNLFDIVVPYVHTEMKNNKHAVKIISNPKGKILYFSRSLCPYPYNKKKINLKKHLSIVSFKKKSLLKFINYKPGDLEITEGIELMRALENDLEIGTFRLKGESMAIDIREDIIKVKRAIKNDPIRRLY